MNFEIGKLVDLNIFDPLEEGPRQIVLADHLDQRRIGIGVRYHGKPRLPFAAVAQPDTDGSAVVVDQDFFDMMDGTNLPAVMNVSTLQDLRDGMRAAARQLRLLIAGNHL